MSYEIQTVASPTRDTQMECRRSYPTYSISPDMVCIHKSPIPGLKLTKFSELSIAPDMNVRLVPPHARKALKSKGIDLDNFVPMSKDEMMARLD